MAQDPQSQSPLLSRLPREILDAVYLELWRSCGLRQHIIYHGPRGAKHFCRWPCAIEFEVKDEVQKNIEDMAARRGVTLGEEMRDRHDPVLTQYCRRLQSAWWNHWPCGELAAEEHGQGAITSPSTAGLVCWKDKPPSRSPYMPMLLCCKMISEQCLSSIYASTTFIFTDLMTIQAWFGWCVPPPVGPGPPTPPAFFKHTKSVELSLSPAFPQHLSCVSMDLPGQENRHDAYDFHWLCLPRFESLQHLHIWISARSLTPPLDSSDGFVGIKQFDARQLRVVLATLAHIPYVTLSTPLSSSVGPVSGYVEDASLPSVRLYKRSAGDKFHPFLTSIQPGGYLDGRVLTSPTPEVRLARNGGVHAVMRED